MRWGASVRELYSPPFLSLRLTKVSSLRVVAQETLMREKTLNYLRRNIRENIFVQQLHTLTHLHTYAHCENTILSIFKKNGDLQQIQNHKMFSLIFMSKIIDGYKLLSSQSFYEFLPINTRKLQYFIMH